MKYVSTEQMEAVRFAHPPHVASPALVVYARPKIEGRPAVYYGYFGPDASGLYPPSLGWRRLLIDGKVFELIGDKLFAPDGSSKPFDFG